ncbi:hypothetical protein SB861_56095, partial [Paraburkholderia sp. SIMBA_049]
MRRARRAAPAGCVGEPGTRESIASRVNLDEESSEWTKAFHRAGDPASARDARMHAACIACIDIALACRDNTGHFQFPAARCSC